MRNPFEYGRELGPGELAGRAREVAEVRDALLGGAKYFLIGPRRYGKSSIHNVAAHAARKRGAVVLRYNVEAFGTLEPLIATIVADTARLLKGPVKRVGARLGELFRTLRPELTYHPLTHSWSVGLEATPAERAVPRLVEVLDGVERAAAGFGRPVGLVLDEIQHLVAGGIEAERQLRAAVQQHRHVGYVFAGSDTRLLAAMTSDPARPFYRLGEVRVLQEIPRPEFIAFLAAGFEALRAKVAEGALPALLDEADDVPYNVQLLAHQCWNALRDQGRGAVLTPALVREVHRDAATRMDPVYSQAWLALTGPQRRALQAVVLEAGAGLYAADVAHRYLLPASSMKKSLEALVTKRIVRREARSQGVRLRLEDPLFGLWVRESVVAQPPGRAPTPSTGEGERR
jgi:hypothetical protein